MEWATEVERLIAVLGVVELHEGRLRGTPGKGNTLD